MGNNMLSAARGTIRAADGGAVAASERQRSATPEQRTRAWVVWTLLVSIVTCILAFQVPDKAFLTADAVVPAGIATAFTLLIPGLLARAFFVSDIHAAPIAVALLLHGLIVILSFAGIYNGAVLAGCPEGVVWQELYFSMVTFTTLGYGDCSPVCGAELFAATQALFSYIYFGVVVGVLANLERRLPTASGATSRQPSVGPSCGASRISGVKFKACG